MYRLTFYTISAQLKIFIYFQHVKNKYTPNYLSLIDSFVPKASLRKDHKVFLPHFIFNLFATTKCSKI